MSYKSFEELPSFLQTYIREIVDDQASAWVHQPVPALRGKSLLQFINDEGVRKAAQYLTNVGTKFGVPRAVAVPTDFRET